MQTQFSRNLKFVSHVHLNPAENRWRRAARYRLKGKTGVFFIQNLKPKKAHRNISELKVTCGGLVLFRPWKLINDYQNCSRTKQTCCCVLWDLINETLVVSVWRLSDESESGVGSRVETQIQAELRLEFHAHAAPESGSLRCRSFLSVLKRSTMFDFWFQKQSVLPPF